MSYEMVDRFLRNNLDDNDYLDYSAALDEALKQAKREVLVEAINCFSKGYWNDAGDVINELRRMAEKLK